jgi:hypothetical protein
VNQEHIDAVIDAIFDRGLRFAVAVRNGLNDALRGHVSMWHRQGDKEVIRRNLGTNRTVARIKMSYEHGTGNRQYHAYCPAKEFRGMFLSFDEAATVCDVHLQQQGYAVAVPRGTNPNPFQPFVEADLSSIEMRS